MEKNQWIDVDKDGLAKLLEKRGKSFAIYELIQNAWDTDTRKVLIELYKYSKRPFARIIIEDDDPNGFEDLAHSYTMFAESTKKKDPSKRGVFCMGEKLVLAMCKRAKVSSTKGSVIFKEDGTRIKKRAKREKGSVFDAEIRMNQKEYDEVIEGISRLIPPKEIETSLNGAKLEGREPVAVVPARLKTVSSDSNGNLQSLTTSMQVELYKPNKGETAHIYEMGIPVVETGDKWHYNVTMRVPVNMNRDNVPPSYLKKLRVQVLNEAYKLLTKADVSAQWVDEALEHPMVWKETVNGVMDKRFGKKRAIYDPSDQEANNRLTGRGYTVIPPRTFSKDAWKNVKSGNTKPSGRIAPTPKPYSNDPDAVPVHVVPLSFWWDSQKRVAELARRISVALLGFEVDVRMVKAGRGFAACYGARTVDFNSTKIGRKRFDSVDTSKGLDYWLDLIIHELAHEKESNHLSENYHETVSAFGGKLARLAWEGKIRFD